MNLKKAISFIEKRGALLVFPIHNQKEPWSLWSEFYPKSTMRWEWDESGDNRVADLWHLREELSRSRKVVYGKWYKGRATVFSRELFSAMWPVLSVQESLSTHARNLLSILEQESPLSTKELKRQGGLQGKVFEGTFQKALKELWTRLLIVGFGEVDDGAFPSLAIGATSALFEELLHVKPKRSVEDLLKENPLILKEFEKVRKQLLIQKPSPTKGRQTLRGVDLAVFTKK